MLIGNRERFAIELSPVSPSWERRYRPEEAAWAGLSLWASGANLCRHVRSGEEGIREAFYVPLAPIATWIVQNYAALAFEERASLFVTRRRLHDAVHAWGDAPAPAGLDEDAWLDAREAFWKRHFLAAGAEGSRVPNVAFLREDNDVLITWRPPRFAAPPHVDILHPDGTTTAPWSEVSRVLLDFVLHVAEAFSTALVPPPFDWMPLGSAAWERFEPEQAIELYCGRSLSQVADIGGPLEPLLGAARSGDPGASPTLQIIRDLPPRPSASIGTEIVRTVDQAGIHDSKRSAAWLAGRATASDAARAGSSPEEQGHLAARAIRDELRLNGQPIDSVPEIVARYGVSLGMSTVPSAHERMIIAARAEGTAVATILSTARTTTAWGRRFEEARALGHALLDTTRHGALGAASTRWAQESRRRRSGAFAAELLFPASALSALSDGSLDGAADGDRFGRMLTQYGVGARTAANQLYNEGWLSDSAIRDELIEEYGHREG
jgi:hypothetical protein